MRQTACLLVVLLFARTLAAENVTPHVSFEPGAVNAVLVEQGGKHLAIYGVAEATEPACEQVLLTHHRRDVVWLARPAVAGGAAAVAPEAELALIEKPADFWNAFTTNRFHDYAQQSTKILAQPLSALTDIERVIVRGLHWFGNALCHGESKNELLSLTTCR